jgi:hypothetical protein
MVICGVDVAGGIDCHREHVVVCTPPPAAGAGGEKSASVVITPCGATLRTCSMSAIYTLPSGPTASPNG